MDSLHDLPSAESLQTNLGPRVQASLQDRWAIVGMTGCGKTTFAKRLVSELRRGYPAARVYILDSKQAGDFTGIDGHTVDHHVAPDALRTPGAVQIWQPPDDNQGQYDDWFKKILKARKPALILIDELSSLGGNSGRSYPAGYAQIQKQGRGLDICTLTLTQEAAYIPRQTLSQVTHLLRFTLLNRFDAAAVDTRLGRETERDNPPDRYGFYYRRCSEPGEHHYYRDYRDFFR